MTKGLFIACEGLDCAGKTTSINHALSYLGRQFLYSKGLKTSIISRYFTSTFSLLLELLPLDWFFVRPRVQAGMGIMQDRWYYSILSHNSPNLKDYLLGKLFVPFLSKPDMLVYFSVAHNERIKRLKRSADKKDHQLLVSHPELITQREKRMLRYYHQFHGKKAVLDTTARSPEQSGYALYRLIKEAFAK